MQVYLLTVQWPKMGSGSCRNQETAAGQVRERGQKLLVGYGDICVGHGDQAVKQCMGQVSMGYVLFTA